MCKIVAQAAVLWLVTSSTSALAQTASEIESLLRSWDPLDVKVEGRIATVKLPQDRITDTIYYASITAGFCLGPLLNVDVNDVSEVRILNRFGQQGWVFENEQGLCELVAKEPASRVKIMVAGHTHIF